MSANMEQAWSDTRILLEIPGWYPEQIRTQLATTTRKRIGILTISANQVEQSEFHSRHLIIVQVSIESFFLKKDHQVRNWISKQTHEVCCTTRLSPLVLRPVSFRKDTIRGQTPTMFPTTSNREGIERSPDTTARLKA